MSNSFKVFQDEKGDIFYLTEQYLEMIDIENKNNLKVGNYLIFDCVIHSNHKIIFVETCCKVIKLKGGII